MIVVNTFFPPLTLQDVDYSVVRNMMLGQVGNMAMCWVETGPVGFSFGM